MVASYISKKIGILLSVFVSTSLIFGAYALAKNTSTPKIAVASTETELLAVIAQRDTDKDGLPDWEEVLYGTNPTERDTRQLGMSDGEAVSRGLIVPRANVPMPISTNKVEIDDTESPAQNTLTSVFAQSLFSKYILARQENGGDLSTEQISSLVQNARQQLMASVRPASNFKTKEDLSIIASSPDLLRKYAISAEEVLSTHSGNLSESELFYLDLALRNGDSEAIHNLEKLSRAYIDSAMGLVAIAVPSDLSGLSLDLINVLYRIGNEIGDFSRVTTDPIATMLSLAQYRDSIDNMIEIFQKISEMYIINNSSIEVGAQGSGFVNLIASIEPAQKP